MWNPLKCLTCSHNNGDTEITIRSKCFEKPVIIRIDTENDEKIAEMHNILKQLINLKNSF